MELNVHQGSVSVWESRNDVMVTVRQSLRILPKLVGGSRRREKGSDAQRIYCKVYKMKAWELALLTRREPMCALCSTLGSRQDARLDPLESSHQVYTGDFPAIFILEFEDTATLSITSYPILHLAGSERHAKCTKTCRPFRPVFEFSCHFSTASSHLSGEPQSIPIPLPPDPLPPPSKPPDLLPSVDPARKQLWWSTAASCSSHAPFPSGLLPAYRVTQHACSPSSAHISRPLQVARWKRDAYPFGPHTEQGPRAVPLSYSENARE
ncbi:hypothetical protein EDB86DRAFT_2268935 [Lactarius hatsudake]|nr:hypothetical protein EDB86DRAFT_2268935 [Lactarius hatsudake]